MTTELMELAQNIARSATKRGADEARVCVERQRYIYLQQSDGELEQIEESSTMSASVNLYVNGRASQHATSDLRPSSLERFIETSVEATRCLAPDPHQGLPDPALYQGYEPRDLDLMDTENRGGSIDARQQIVLDLERAVDFGEGLLHLETIWYETLRDLALINTNGFEGCLSTTQFWAGIDMTVVDRNGRRTRNGQYNGSRHRDRLPSPSSIAREVVERTRREMGATTFPSRRLPMIVENRAAGRLLSNLIMPMLGSSLHQDRSFIEDHEGEQIFSKAMTLVDDPLVPGGLGSRLFDEEGIPSRRRVMIDEGVLRHYWIDVEYANKTGREATSGSPSNLLLPGGLRSLDALIKDVGTGILVTGFLGGNSNSTTGDFSVGINGLYFEKGEFVQPVQEMNVAGNQMDFWKRLVEVGNDPWTNSSFRLPSLVFDDILFSGSAA